MNIERIEAGQESEDEPSPVPAESTQTHVLGDLPEIRLLGE